MVTVGFCWFCMMKIIFPNKINSIVFHVINIELDSFQAGREYSNHLACLISQMRKLGPSHGDMPIT